MGQAPPERRFADALAKARAQWAAADAAACAARAGCERTEAGVLVQFVGRSHLVTHPGGRVTVMQGGSAADAPHAPDAPDGSDGSDGRDDAGAAAAAPVHVAVAVLLLHYLLAADGTPPAGTWIAYRELPDGLFYASAFAARAEEPLTRAFAGSQPRAGDSSRPDAFSRAAVLTGGEALSLGDASFRFRVLPRLDIAVLVWVGDEEEPGEARVLFDANAGHYLPAEDLAGLGGQLAHRLAAAAAAAAAAGASSGTG